MASLIATDKATTKTGWDTRHNAALHLANGSQAAGTHEGAILNMVRAWENYGAAHKSYFETPIGEDYYLGPEWQQIGESIRALLNGLTGRIDCGTVDGFILNTMAENGIDISKL